MPMVFVDGYGKIISHNDFSMIGNMALTYYSGEEIKQIRERLGLSQKVFWAIFQATQSAGSRYESCRNIPESVQLLLNIALNSPQASAAVVDAMRQAVTAKPSAKRRATQARKTAFRFGLPTDVDPGQT